MINSRVQYSSCTYVIVCCDCGYVGKATLCVHPRRCRGKMLVLLLCNLPEFASSWGDVLFRATFYSGVQTTCLLKYSTVVLLYSEEGPNVEQGSPLLLSAPPQGAWVMRFDPGPSRFYSCTLYCTVLCCTPYVGVQYYVLLVQY
jgi:hypothetical protein